MGKPAARQGDLTESGGPIIQGSNTVLIGSQGGIACSTCPGGKAIGSPVNPTLGAKVLLGPEDLDFAVPGPMPLVWQRQYSSYVNAERGPQCGLLGWGWRLPHELRLQLKPTQTLLHDAGGRIITFGEPLRPGQTLQSDSEALLLLRGGGAKAYNGGRPANLAQELLPWMHQPRWAHIPALARSDASYVLAATQTGRTAWIFKAQANGDCHLVGLMDAFGRTLQYHHNEHGRLTAITDGAGRRYALLYNRESEPAEHASNARATSAGPIDTGLRLMGVDCVHNPHGHSTDPPHAVTAPSKVQPVPLVRYHYSPQGDLVETYGRDGQRTRQFRYDSQHRMVAHRVRNGPEHTYVYDADHPGARVIEHHNEEGLSYHFSYQDEAPQDPKAASCTTVRDSLDRTTEYHHQGRGGLKRIARQVNPDGSEEHYHYDGAGCRIAVTAPLGRTIHWRYDGQGNLLGVQGPDGRSSQQRWGLPGTAQDGLLLQSTSASGINTHYTYDSWGRLTETTVTAADLISTTRLQYQEGPPHTLPPTARAWADQPQAIIDSQGGRKTLGYNACGQLTRYTDCSGHTTHWQYDAWGVLIEETDALGHRTLHQRDALGRLLQTQQADGSLVQYRWGDNGQVQAINLGSVAHRTSDTGLATVTTTVAYEHDLWGRVTAQTQAGASLHLRYDGAGRITELINENHAATRFTYDSQDRLIQEVGFDGRTQSYRYDAAGQLIEKTDSQDSSMAAATEGAGTVRSRYHYDSAGRLTHRITAKAEVASEAADPTANTDLQIHQFSYCDSGELLSTQGWELSAEATTALINDWLQLSTEQLRIVLNQQHDPQALASSPWLQSLQVQHLQNSSRVDLQRDSFGRTTGEVQTLYHLLDSLKSGANKTALATEFEHRIHHRLGALGERQASELQGIGQLDWLTYGSGHVHGVLLNQTPLLALERDKLHREVGRSLHLLPHGAEHEHTPAITQTRQLDPLGRLLHQRWQGLPGQASAPKSAAPLIGGLQQRRYTYDSLGQLVGIQTPTEANVYQYDNRQRLIGQTQASAQGEHEHRWRLDPAGNRLPGKAAAQRLGAKSAASADWSARVHQNLHDPRFNLLQTDGSPDTPADQNVERWRNNRIGWSQNADNQGATHYRYDSWGNRTQALHSNGSITQLHYDSLHQLRRVTQIDAQGTEQSSTSYRYDAFGRRVSKTHQKTGQQSQTTHFGWDGDRLVHTETAERIHHTVYEPGSFVPLLQMERNKAGQTDPVKILLGLSNNETNSPLEQELPRQEREILHQALQVALQPGYELSGLLPQEMRSQVQKSIQTLKNKQAQTQQENPLTIRHVLTDHLGTPLALVNANGAQKGQVTWAAEYTAWGEIAEEYNPDQIFQPIRLQGQQLDEETGLHYNRFRYYDPKIGQYISQDPIGLEGGLNKFSYTSNAPLRRIDPMGLEWKLGKTYPKNSEHPLSPKNNNTVYCDDEELKINSNNVGRCQKALGTTEAHERSHLNDIKNANPSICKNNNGITEIITSDTEARLASEKTAHELELQILEKAIKEPPAGCTARGIEAEINATKDGLSKVRAGTYPN
ncbi:MAG: RHS repeat-associated core domain-containing protein [Acidovorax sp.]|uniref:RHS repeat-associated core domain-containing protein n=1 Tax=Acidovorax sp. TaxID=1872122 RepID=UPI002633EDEB|nr:RHS repeat-associated core domain-containing protein [Acidovorax sp.]MDH4415957.1 RHS repeat-associated core domain-containing protein [Acidovorax sp.]